MVLEWILEHPEGAAQLAGVIGLLFAAPWAIYKYFADKKSQSETRRIEASRPFLDQQLKLYSEAAESAAILASSTDPEAVRRARATFWELYWGSLALVEDKQVEAAMEQVGGLVEKGLYTTPEMQDASLTLAHACRDSLAKSWGVNHWRKP